MYTIIELTENENLGYREFFLQGLERHSSKFRISPNDAKNENFPTTGQPDSFTLAAVDDNKLLGVVSFQREGITREKLRHKGLIFRMYVASDFAGKGIGRALLATLLEKVSELEGLEQINLTVISTNSHAIAFYESFGFTRFSRESNAIKYKEEYFDEDQMVLKLK